jgi:hypothetical protein
MPRTRPTTITVDETELTLVLEREKRVKNVNAHLRGATLSGSAPAEIPDERLDRVVAELAAPFPNSAPSSTSLSRSVMHPVFAPLDAL